MSASAVAVLDRQCLGDHAAQRRTHDIGSVDPEVVEDGDGVAPCPTAGTALRASDRPRSRPSTPQAGRRRHPRTWSTVRSHGCRSGSRIAQRRRTPGTTPQPRRSAARPARRRARPPDRHRRRWSRSRSRRRHCEPPARARSYPHPPDGRSRRREVDRDVHDALGDRFAAGRCGVPKSARIALLSAKVSATKRVTPTSRAHAAGRTGHSRRRDVASDR